MDLSNLDIAAIVPCHNEEGAIGKVVTDLRRIRIAWLLLATLMPFFAVKAIHHHEVVPSAICQTTDAGQSQSACGDDSCPICHFSLEPFTPGESLTLSVTLSYTHHEPGTLREPLFGQPVASYNLRAPPAC